MNIKETRNTIQITKKVKPPSIHAANESNVPEGENLSSSFSSAVIILFND